MSSQERDNFGNHEAFDANRLEDARRQNQERIKEDIERNVETKSHEQLEDARQEALEKSKSIEKHENQDKKEQSTADKRGVIPKKDRDISFNKTMSEVRLQMSTPSRIFSQVIHNKTISHISEAVGQTVARPNAILSGSIVAFIFTLLVYLIARYNGYPLSGAETIISFAVGWVAGLVFDYIRMLVSGKA